MRRPSKPVSLDAAGSVSAGTMPSIGAATMRRQWQTFLIRLPALDAASSVASLEELCPSEGRQQKLSDFAKRLSARPLGVLPQTWWPVAGTCVIVATLCVLPFARILDGNAGSPQFFSFALHSTVIMMYAPRATLILTRRQLPMHIHAVVASLWCLSRILKWEGYERLPFTACLISCNMQFPFGLAVQILFFGKRYSPAQLAGAALVLLGITLSCFVMQRSTPASQLCDFRRGLLASLSAAFCVALQSSVMKFACKRYGCSVQENILFMHLCALCVIFPLQWDKVKPHILHCLGHGDDWLSISLVTGVLLHFAARSLAALLARRAPNLLAAQGVQALAGCAQVMAAGISSTRSFPTHAWWAMLMIPLGMLHYLRASDCCELEEDKEETALLLPLELRSPQIRSVWAIATAEAKHGREDAIRVENLAWRKLGLHRRKVDAWTVHFKHEYLEVPAVDRCISLEELNPVSLEEEKLPCLVQRACDFKGRDPGAQKAQFLPLAMASIALGAMCVFPYSNLLRADPGSPLCFSFVLHVVVITSYLPKARSILYARKIPLSYHATMGLLWCLFTTLRSDAYTRLPTSVCMLVGNSRMLVGLIVQFSLFGKRYSASQITGAMIVTVGIAWAGNAMQQSVASKSGSSRGASDFAIGVLEVLGSTFALALQSSVIKVAFSRFGERVEEQVFFVHLIALLVVFPSKWSAVGPRLLDWATELNPWMLLNLIAAVILNFASRSVDTRLAGRAPNLLLMQLVQTVDGFLQLLIAALLRVPPWPPSGFWGGALVLLLGTLQYLRASGAPLEERLKDGLVQETLGRKDWAVATVEAKQGSNDAARRENLAWRKMAMAKTALMNDELPEL